MNYWEMGGYAAYVWPAYGISFIVLALNAWAAFFSRGSEE